MNRITRPLLLLSALVVCAQTADAAPRTFVIDDKDKRDLVSFTSDAPIELIVGNTPKISGKVTMDDSLDLTKPVAASFDVDLASIDTGIPLRNEHMRDNFLETKKFPKATFVLKKLSNPVKLEPNKKVKLSGEGDFTLHGKTVSKKVDVEVMYVSSCPKTWGKMPGCDLMQIRTTFKVPFTDHGIKRPEVVFQKLADTVVISVSATAYSDAAKGDAKPAADKAPGKDAAKAPAKDAAKK